MIHRVVDFVLIPAAILVALLFVPFIRSTDNA